MILQQPQVPNEPQQPGSADEPTAPTTPVATEDPEVVEDPEAVDEPKTPVDEANSDDSDYIEIRIPSDRGARIIIEEEYDNPFDEANMAKEPKIKYAA